MKKQISPGKWQRCLILSRQRFTTQPLEPAGWLQAYVFGKFIYIKRVLIDMEGVYSINCYRVHLEGL